MVKTAEGPGTRTQAAVWCCEPVLRPRYSMLRSCESSRIESGASTVEIVAVHDGGAVGDVGVVVVDDCPVSPITSPVVPAPRETGQEAEPEA